MKKIILSILLLVLSSFSFADGVCDSSILNAYEGKSNEISEDNESLRNCVGEIIANDLSIKSIALLFPEQVDALWPLIIGFFTNNNVYDENFINIAKQYDFMDIVYKAFNFLAFFVGIILFSIFLIKEIKAGSTQGEAFGVDKEGNGYFAVKSVLGFFLLAPIAGGFTMGQYLIIFCALVGISFAIFIWVAFMLSSLFLISSILGDSSDNSGSNFAGDDLALSAVNIGICDIQTKEYYLKNSPDDAEELNSCFRSSPQTNYENGSLVYNPLKNNTYYCLNDVIGDIETVNECGFVGIKDGVLNEDDFKNFINDTRRLAYSAKVNYCLESGDGKNKENKKVNYDCVKMDETGTYVEGLSEEYTPQISDEPFRNVALEKEALIENVNSLYSSTSDNLNNENKEDKVIVKEVKRLFDIGWLSTTVLFYKINQITKSINPEDIGDYSNDSFSYAFDPFSIRIRDVMNSYNNIISSNSLLYTSNNVSIKNTNLGDIYFSNGSSSLDILNPNVNDKEDFSKKSQVSFFAFMGKSNESYENVLLTTIGFNVASQVMSSYVRATEVEGGLINNATVDKASGLVKKGKQPLVTKDEFERHKRKIGARDSISRMLVRVFDILGMFSTMILLFITFLTKGIPLFLLIFMFSVFVSYIISIFKLFIMVPAFGFMHLMDAKTKSLSGSYNYIYSGMLNLMVRPVLIMLSFLAVFLLIVTLGSLAYYLVFSIGNVAIMQMLGGNFILNIIAYAVIMIMYLIFLVYISYKSIKLVYKIPNEADSWLSLETDPDGFWNKFIEMSSQWFMARLNTGMLLR